MRKILKIFTISIILLFEKNSSSAQVKQVKDFTLPKQSYTDSLYAKICDPIYTSFYNPLYMLTTEPTFTILKIDIDKKGKVTNVSFSDSADSTFVKAYLERRKWPDETGTIEKYAKAKSYKDVSLLMPVNFEPKYPNSVKGFSYDKMESILKFSKKEFVGKSIMLPAMNIRVLSEHNM